MTLTEFLLARIGEDEAAAQHGDGGLLDHEDAHFTRARMLSECEAKRAIVENAEYNRRRTPLMVEHDIFAWHARVLGWTYRDHPDYDDSWRP